jgi:hypothetical protein
VSPVAWLLNFDADEELAVGAGYNPSRATLERLRELPARLVGLVRPGDVVAGDEPLDERFLGLAWCPTPRARARLAALGVRVPRAPALEVLRRANHRRFAAELGDGLPGAAFVGAVGEVAARVAQPTPSGRWLLKRPFSRAGSGRRCVPSGELGAADGAWVTASLARDGLQVEPWVELVVEVALHGFVAEAGAITLGELCAQEVDRHGAWQKSARAPDAGAVDERRALFAAAERAGQALRGAGYFGPFGIDGYRYRDDGAVAFNPLSELNARYTMGWAVGMGARRPDREVSAPPPAAARRRRSR